MKGRVHNWTLEILMIVLIIFISTKISFLFHPVVIFVSTLFFPVLISGFLFFIFNPIVDWLIRAKLPRGSAIVALYLCFIGLLVLVGMTVGPILSQQITDLIENTPGFVTELRSQMDSLSQSRWFNWIMEQDYVSLDEIEQKIVEFTTGITSNITSSISKIVSVVTNVTLIIVTVPFLLFYMLKDGNKLPDSIVKFFPPSYHLDVKKILGETTSTLAAYIQGQMLVCLFVGVASLIGYKIIDLNYALTLGIIIAITNIIPYVGPFIGAAPAVVIALLDSPIKAILVVVVIVVVQQLDGNIISPLVIGNRLNIHPLTIIILLLVAGSLAGILGMILAVPTYAVSKTIIQNIIRLIKLRKGKEEIIT